MKTGMAARKRIGMSSGWKHLTDVSGRPNQNIDVILRKELYRVSSSQQFITLIVEDCDSVRDSIRGRPSVST